MKKKEIIKIKDNCLNNFVTITTNDDNILKGIVNHLDEYMGDIEIDGNRLLIKDIKTIDFPKLEVIEEIVEIPNDEIEEDIEDLIEDTIEEIVEEVIEEEKMLESFGELIKIAEPPKDLIYKYVLVDYIDIDTLNYYNYKTDIEDIEIDDYVLVDRAGDEVIAKVVDINYYTREEVPYPVEKTKNIIKVIEREEEKQDFVSSDEFNYSFNDIEEKVIKRLKELGLRKKQYLQMLLLLRTHTNSDRQCEKMLSFLEGFDIEVSGYNEIERYASLLADEENYFKHSVYCKAMEGTIAYIDCLKLSDDCDTKGIDYEFNEKCRSCKYHCPKMNSKGYKSKEIIHFEGLNTNVLDRIDYEDIIAITIAEQGAMGLPGNIELVTRVNNEFFGYQTNPIYGGLGISDLYNLIPWLRDFKCLSQEVYNVGEGWTHIDSGYGNHLLIRDYLIEEMNKKIKNKEVEDIYNNWKKYLNEIYSNKEDIKKNEVEIEINDYDKYIMDKADVLLKLTNKLTKEKLMTMNEDDVMFITCPGRMGDENGVNLIVRENNQLIKYRVNELSEVYKEMQEIFPKWFELWMKSYSGIESDKYKKIVMGFGNLLFVDNRIYDEYIKYLVYLAKKNPIYTESDGDNYNVCINFQIWDIAFLEMITKNREN